jgi:hypothetical protein
MDSFYPVMPDPDPASSVVTAYKYSGFRVKPGMTKKPSKVVFLIATQSLRTRF